MKKTIIIFLLFFLEFLFSFSSQAIGLINKPLVINNALRGQVIVDQLSIFNSDKTEETFSLSADGDIKDWVKFYLLNKDNNKDNNQDSVNEVKVAPKSYYKVAVNIFIPDNIANETYEGRLVINKTVDSSSEKNHFNVVQRLSRKVSIKVTDKEYINLLAYLIPKKYALSHGEDLPVRIILENKGNVTLSPQVEVKIKKENKELYNVIYPYSADISGVKPGEVKEVMIIKLPSSNFSNGNYKAEFDFLHNNKSIAQKNFHFKIDDKYFMWGMVEGLKIRKFDFSYLLIVFSLLVVFLVIIYLIFYPKRKSLSKNTKNSKKNTKNKIKSFLIK